MLLLLCHGAEEYFWLGIHLQLSTQMWTHLKPQLCSKIAPKPDFHFHFNFFSEGVAGVRVVRVPFENKLVEIQTFIQVILKALRGKKDICGRICFIPGSINLQEGSICWNQSLGWVERHKKYHCKKASVTYSLSYDVILGQMWANGDTSLYRFKAKSEKSHSRALPFHPANLNIF